LPLSPLIASAVAQRADFKNIAMPSLLDSELPDFASQRFWQPEGVASAMRGCKQPEFDNERVSEL